MSWPPEGSELLLEFRVDGDPKPAGSKNAIPLGRRDPTTGEFKPYRTKDGRPIVNMRDSSGVPGENWRTDIRAAVASALDVAHELVDGPLAVRVTFYGARPKGDYGTGRNAGVMKPTAPAYPHASKLADGTKLARALEDALNELVWTDDRRVVDLWWSRRFGRPGADVAIYRLPAMRLELAPAARPAELSLLDPGDGLDQGVIMGADERDGTTEEGTVAAAVG